MRAIGTIRTPFAASAGTPIQSRYAQGAEGTVEIFDEFAAGLKDIEGFDRLWLIYLFDRAVEAQLVVRPYLDNAQHGIFATRSPARPNRIGISSVRLLHVEGTRVEWAAAPGEAIYGLGQRFNGLNQSGKWVEMWIREEPGQGKECG